MKLNTSKKEYTVVIEEGAEKAVFYGHPLTPKEVSQYLRKATRKTWDKGQRFEDVDFYAFKLLKIRTIIQRWEGIEDENGSAIECNDNMKEVVYLYNTKLIDSAIAKFDEIGEDIQDEEEYLEKNLSPGSAGISKKGK